MEDMDDVEQIVSSKLPEELKSYARIMVNFAEWFGKQYGAGDATSGVISLRDILAWINFITTTYQTVGIELSILHGACMVFVDSIGTNASAVLAETPELLKKKKETAVKQLSKLLKKDLLAAYLERHEVVVNADKLSVGPFSINRTTDDSDVSFNLQAPTTAVNALRVMRGMQVKKPILLEGSPGVGKTSLITAIAKVSGNPLTRINLSEQTDLIDLFGSDSPAEGGGADQFVWRDAPFLRAMQQGKTSLVRFLAQIVGAELHEFAMNGDIDSMDLLGGFDQVDHNQKVSIILDEIREFCVKASCRHFVDPTSSSKFYALELLNVLNSLEINIDSLKALCGRLEASGFEKLAVYKQNLEEIIVKMGDSNQAKFEWFDGTLLKAVENGHWLVLDNANLCNPSVLDRLNSLLEPNGCLIVNECSSSNGEPRMVKPHDDFRLFLTMDPKYGELSRAMRNRGVEIFLEDLNTRATPFDRKLLNITNHGEEADTTGVRTSVSEFVSSKDAVMHFFSLLEDSNIVSESLNDKFVVNSQFSFFPQSLLPYAERWSSNIKKFGVYSQQEKEKVVALTDFLKTIDSSEINSAVKELGESAVTRYNLSPYLVETSSFNPIVNSFFSYHMDSTSNGLTTANIAMLLLTVPFLYSTYQTLERAKQNALSLKPTSLSYLDRAAAFHVNKPLKDPARVDVYKIIESVLDFSNSVLKKVFQVDVAKISFNITSLIKLQQIATDLITLTVASFTDESQLHIYREFFEEWYADNQNNELYATVFEKLQTAIAEFGSQLVLTSGTSMQTIWQKWKPQRPVSKIAWDRYERITVIAQKFDEISVKLFADSLETVLSLRSIIIQTIADATSYTTSDDELDLAISTLESGIDQLHQDTLSFTTERKHYFKNGFQMLSQILEFSTSQSFVQKQEIINELSSLAYYSEGSTLHLTRYYNNDISKYFQFSNI
ncbi:hypothetical protein D0Z03_001325 [Geotrichum reessii]|nr:hypothetical protein D0Z03_001325 [Galactomyces reessii]